MHIFTCVDIVWTRFDFLKIELHSCEHARQRHPWFRLLSAVLLVTRQFVDGHDTCRDNTVLAVA